MDKDAVPPTPGQEYTVRPDDCIDSIAQASGQFWETIWEDPANAALREARNNPNVLREGDRVFIPPIRPKSVPCATGRKHVFRRKGVPVRLRLQILMPDNSPRAAQPFSLAVDGLPEPIAGETDAEGILSAWIPSQARQGTLTIGPDEAVLEIKIGMLDPVAEITGMKQRLKNLGYPCGAVDRELDEKTAAQLKRFQADQGLPESGENDEATQAALLRLHGC